MFVSSILLYRRLTIRSRSEKVPRVRMKRFGLDGRSLFVTTAPVFRHPTGGSGMQWVSEELRFVRSLLTCNLASIRSCKIRGGRDPGPSWLRLELSDNVLEFIKARDGIPDILVVTRVGEQRWVDLALRMQDKEICFMKHGPGHGIKGVGLSGA